MIHSEKGTGNCLNCMKMDVEVNKISIMTPFRRDDRDFDLCDDCAKQMWKLVMRTVYNKEGASA